MFNTKNMDKTKNKSTDNIAEDLAEEHSSKIGFLKKGRIKGSFFCANVSRLLTKTKKSRPPRGDRLIVLAHDRVRRSLP